MIIKHGDMFTTDAEAIGHGVNTQGLMGAGVAVLVRDKFPRTYLSYAEACQWSNLSPGGVHLTRENGIFVFNMATQQRPGAYAQLYLVEMASRIAVDRAFELDIDRIAIPQIGCGIGGLMWNQVELVLKASERPGFEWEVWIYG